MDISAVVCTYNEESNIERLINSLQDCQEILIFDDNSTDRTKEIAEKMGAKVFTRKDSYDTITAENVKHFQDRYGYLPKFKAGDRFRDMSKIRNNAVSYSKNEWVYFPDADEIVTWSFVDIKKMLDQCDMIECKLVQSRNPDGTPASLNHITKLYKKSKARWIGRNHEVVAAGGPVKIIRTDLMRIDHDTKPRKAYSVVAPLEYEILSDDAPRWLFYLGREYYYEKRYENAISVFDKYIKIFTWLPELAEVYFFKALCLWQLHRGDEARTCVMAAMSINPNMKKAFHLMAEMVWPHHRQQWLKMAELADNTGVVFTT